MKESIGSVFLFNLIIIFIVLVFSILAITMSYTKAFRVNSLIVDSVEKFEGYNDYTRTDVIRVLTGIGYSPEPNFSVNNCPTRYGTDIQDNGRNFPYRVCIYHLEEDGPYYRYGVLTYAYINIPIVGELIRFPVYSETTSLYDFDMR